MFFFLIFHSIWLFAASVRKTEIKVTLWFKEAEKWKISATMETRQQSKREKVQRKLFHGFQKCILFRIHQFSVNFSNAFCICFALFVLMTQIRFRLVWESSLSEVVLVVRKKLQYSKSEFGIQFEFCKQTKITPVQEH